MLRYGSFIFFICLCLGCSCLGTKESAVDHYQYLGNQTNSPGIYDQPPTGSFYSPFNLCIQRMNRLALIDFKGDPLYKRLELQVFDDPRGQGAVVIPYRKDRRLDIYCTAPAFVGYRPLDSRFFVTLDLFYRLDILDTGLDLTLKMKDFEGQAIDVRIKENRAPKPAVAFLAPAGSFQQVQFAFFPVFFMKDAYFWSADLQTSKEGFYLVSQWIRKHS